MESTDFVLRGKKLSLISQLREQGISDENVLHAFEVVERHRFIENTIFWDKAYVNCPVPISCGQTMSQPITVAFQSQLLKIQKNDKVLEIGTGSGFQASILSAMGANVYSIERQIELFRKTRTLLTTELRIRNLSLFFGDGFKGLPDEAPFDKIIVTCGAPDVPTSLLTQLKVGGIIVIPVGDGVQDMKRITKVSDFEYQQESFGEFKFVPMLSSMVKGNKGSF